jgi:quinoprotein glucose dehydrogenase
MSGAIRPVISSAASSVLVVAAWIVFWQIPPTLARRGNEQPTPAIAPGDWPLHNLDLHNSRYSTVDLIRRSNASALTLQWSFDLPNKMSVGTATPLVVGGVMYINSGGTLFALDAATGKQLWTEVVRSTEVNPGGRGPLYAEKRIYAVGRTALFAVDAATGKLIESFGDNGVVRVADRALEFKDRNRGPQAASAESLGYMIASSATYARGVIYLGLAQADSLITGGLVVAMDAGTGRIKWVFRAIPQGPEDDGWELAKDTWSGPNRQGGGVWTQPALDLELGLLYVNISNPSPNYDGSSRKGINLFTNSILALDLETGKLRWHRQVIHHDIWDWDLMTGPTLFDVNVNGKPVKALASLAKVCYVYALNRETGEPIFPIVETAVPTATDMPGEQVWPTQPIPYTARHVPQTPFCATYPPNVRDPELATRRRPMFHPYQVNEFVIVAPGVTGGPNRGSSAFSPRTGWLYITGKNDAWSIKPKPVGASLKPGPGAPGHFQNIAEEGPTGVTPTQNIAAYDPATGELAWVTEFPGATNGGLVVTAGDVLFQAIGREFYTLDATSGAQLSRISMKTIVSSTPLTYLAAGRQYVAIAGGSTVRAFGLPQP